MESKVYRENKSKYWHLIIQKAGLSLHDLARKQILEVGCGPSGIFMIFPDTSDLTLLDPLLNEYTKISPQLISGRKIIGEPLEYAKLESKYDVIIAINCLDHCDDIHLFLRKL